VVPRIHERILARFMGYASFASIIWSDARTQKHLQNKEKYLYIEKHQLTYEYIFMKENWHEKILQNEMHLVWSPDMPSMQRLPSSQL
jgi:hypothetical protein